MSCDGWLSGQTHETGVQSSPVQQFISAQVWSVPQTIPHQTGGPHVNKLYLVNLRCILVGKYVLICLIPKT